MKRTTLYRILIIMTTALALILYVFIILPLMSKFFSSHGIYIFRHSRRFPSLANILTCIYLIITLMINIFYMLICTSVVERIYMRIFKNELFDDE